MEEDRPPELDSPALVSMEFASPALASMSAECRRWGSLSWNAFLGRETRQEAIAHPGLPGARQVLKRVLVTGAGGWIGSALAHALSRALTHAPPDGLTDAPTDGLTEAPDAPQLVLLDASEGALHEVNQSLLERHPGGTAPVAVLGNVCDRRAMDALFDQHRPQVVFHAAAFKHVPLMESNPFAVIENNALGTHVLAEAAARYGCERMILVSTDKAVDPASLMGASKRIAELVMLTARPGGLLTGGLGTQAVRLGNVLGSSGSVVPLFLRQIGRGGPVTVTDPEVRRYFMTTAEAVEALLDALSPGCPPGLLVPEMGAQLRVLDLAKYLIAQTRPDQGRAGRSDEIRIVFTALRPGDKMEESLLSTREAYADGPRGRLRALQSPVPEAGQLAAGVEALYQAVRERDLGQLIETVWRLVPEYKPSPLLHPGPLRSFSTLGNSGSAVDSESTLNSESTPDSSPRPSDRLHAAADAVVRV